MEENNNNKLSRAKRTGRPRSKGCELTQRGHVGLTEKVTFEPSLKEERKLPVLISFFSLSFFIVVQVQLSPFPHPHHSLTPAIPTSHPQSYPPWALFLGPLHMFLDNPSPFSPRYPLPPLISEHISEMANARDEHTKKFILQWQRQNR